MRCVLYLRMSTDKQEASIPQQREALAAFASKHGHELVGEYLDEGISGDKTHKRKGFQAMIRDAAGGGFDRILCWDQSRFGRFDSIEAGSWIAPLRDAGVSLETIDGGIVDWSDFAGRITFAVAQEGKHQFLRDLSRNTLRGQVAKAKSGNGYAGGPTPFGYRRVTEFVGRNRISTLEIDEEAGPIARQIFEEYARPGASCRSVVEFLRAAGVRPIRGQRWRPNTVKRILSNRVYRGDQVWGLRNQGRYHGRAGDEIVGRRPGQGVVFVSPIVHESVIPAIVDRPLFDRVQQLLIERQKATRRPSTVTPLSGLIVCQRCGLPMRGENGNYRCASGSELPAAERCSQSRLSGVAVLEAVAAGIQKHILAPARLRALKARLERLVVAEAEGARRHDDLDLKRRIDELDRRVTEGVARIPLLPTSLVPDMGKELNRLRSQRDDLARQLASIEDAQAGRATPLAERVEGAIAAAYGLREALLEAQAATVNDHLRRLGVRVSVDRENAKASVSVDPFSSSGNLSPMGNDREQVTRRPLATFTVPIPAGTASPRPRAKAG